MRRFILLTSDNLTGCYYGFASCHSVNIDKVIDECSDFINASYDKTSDHEQGIRCYIITPYSKRIKKCFDISKYGYVVLDHKSRVLIQRHPHDDRYLTVSEID